MYKRYLVLAARVLYDVVNEQKKMDRCDAELYLELAQSARSCARLHSKVSRPGHIRLLFWRACCCWMRGRRHLGKYASSVAGVFHAIHPREDTAEYCRFALESFIRDVPGSEPER